MRAFIAVNMGDDLRRALAQAQERLRASGADVKWVRPEGIHLTLKFLGEVDDDRVPAIAEAVAAAVTPRARFRLRVEGIGGFPSPTAPRVIWAGVKDGARELGELARRVEDALEPLGFAREQREFSAHVTLGRCRSPRGRPELAARMREQIERQLGEMEVARVELMRSDLRPTGPIYTSQREFALGEARGERGSDDDGQG
ncbi:MAG TPA: RNA 2',3'-cyclic phosphodiesterase [Armatimonadota bacterium]|nr:RNA 2',3'-cyclic phosphodiesterase [Armatimonadota bacterium]